MSFPDPIDQLPSVKGELNYLKPGGAKPRTYTYDPPDGNPRTNQIPDLRTLPIRDARGLASEVSVDEEGFGLVQHRSAVTDFYDDDEMKRVYYPEAERLLRDITGARRVFVFDHTVRRRV